MTTELDATDSGRAPVRDGPTVAVVEVALLDRSGVIVAVNDAWTAFCTANGGDPRRCGIGVSYPDICEAAAGDRYAGEVAAAIGAALAGDLPAPVQVALPCHGPDAPRWFDVLVSSRFDDAGACAGATVTLSPLLDTGAPVPVARSAEPGADGPAVPAFYPERSERLGDAFAQLLLDRAPLAILVVDDQGTVVRAGRAAERLFGHPDGGLTGRRVRHLLPGVDPFDHRLRLGAPVTGTARPVLSVEGVRADGSTTPVEVRLGHLPLSRGTGAVVLVRPGRPGDTDLPPGRAVVLDHEVEAVVHGLDDVVRQLFACGLTITGVAEARRPDRTLVTTLDGVTDELDGAVRELRAVAFRFQQSARRTPPGRTGAVGAPD